MTDLNVVSQLCNFFDDCVNKCIEHELAQQKQSPASDGKDVQSGFQMTDLNDPTLCEGLFIFSLVWSLGACIADSDRIDFDMYLKELSNLTFKTNVEVNEYVSCSQLPQGAIKSSLVNGLGEQASSTLYDFYFDISKRSWVSWSNFIQPFQRPVDGRFSSTFVQTSDTVRNNFILDTFCQQRRQILLVGESGTAKTTIVKNFLGGLNVDSFQTLSLNFSSRTGSLEVQTTLEANLDRRSKDTLGPPGRKQLIFFIDNISMPIVDVYGTQQPIALLKMLVERKAVYDRNPKSLAYKKIIDVQLIGCFPPPGGSHNKLDPRFVTQFCVLGVSTPSDEAIQHIYSSILADHLKSSNFVFDVSSDDANIRQIDTFSIRLTQTTLKIYKDIQKSLSPTPSRFHYLFNLRDLSRVYEGMTYATKEKFTRAGLLKLWRNEFTRVFCDRLISTEDRQLVEQKIQADLAILIQD